MSILNAYRYVPFYPRKRYKEKYIIIESDDWGMERFLNNNGINYLKHKYPYQSLSRWSADTLETVSVIGMLFELLDEYRAYFEN
tara:strand:+ start:560 stop:811 length:252 start_codon:yes stop_codon:yes gene_type:complete